MILARFKFMEFLCVLILFSGGVVLTQIIPLNGLIAYYPFNYNVFDEGTDDLNLNSPLYDVTFVEDRHGIANQALHFNGIDNFVSFDNITQLQPLEELSVSAWFKSIEGGSPSGAIIRSRPYGYSIWVQPNMIYFEVYSSTITALVCHTFRNNSALDIWHHVVGTYGTMETKLYVDGELVDTTTGGATIQYYSDVVISVGRDVVSSGLFNGSIDEVIVYNRTLDHSEVLQLFNGSKCGTCQPGFASECISRVKCENCGWYFDELDNPKCREVEDFRDLRSSLVLHYKFKDLSLEDFSLFDNSGIPSGKLLSVSDRFGNPNSALEFNGNDSCVKVNKHLSLVPSSNSWTVAFWTKVYSLGSIIMKDGVSNSVGFSIYTVDEDFHDTLSTFQFHFYRSEDGIRHTLGRWKEDISKTKAQLNVWHHIVAVLEGQVMKFYINGTLVERRSFLGSARKSFDDELEIGCPPNSVLLPFNGTLDDLRIFKRALTQRSVEWLWLKAEDTEFDTDEETSSDTNSETEVDTIVREPICFDILANSSLVCSSRGNCTSDGTCVCESEFTGRSCQFNKGVVVAAVVVSTFAGWVFFLIIGIIVIVVIVIFCCGGFAIGAVAVDVRKREKLKASLNRVDLREVNENDFVVHNADEEALEKLKGFLKNSGVKILNFEDISLENYVSAGISGTVFKGKWNDNVIAYKSFSSSDSFGDTEVQSLKNEIELFILVENDFVNSFIGVVLEKSHVGIVTEFCYFGDLKFFIKSNDSLCLKERMRLLCEVCEGMCFVHSKKMIHRDLKPQNVVISEDLKAQLIDFGISRLCSGDSRKTSKIGTLKYMAPEMFNGLEYSNTVDVFSMSIMVWEVICREFNPYPESNSINDAVFKVCSSPDFRPDIIELKESLKELPRDKIEIFANLLQRMWGHDGECRPSFSSSLKVFRDIWRILDEPIVLYIKTSDVNDDDVDDFLLSVLDLESLRKVICENWSDEHIDKIFNPKGKEIISDQDVKGLRDDDIVTVHFISGSREMTESQV